MTEKPSPLASMAAGQIAIQTMLSMLINLYIAGCEDREGARGEIIKTAEDMIDGASIPDLPVADQTSARDQAKFVGSRVDFRQPHNQLGRPGYLAPSPTKARSTL